ncbi:MAG: P-II family nitrogen regulator [Desulfomonilaceae bacterium]
MVLIEAVIKPFKLDDLKDALEDLGVGGLTITEVLQTSQSGWRRPSASTDVGPDAVPKVKVEIAAPEELAARVIEAICVHGSSGRTEDGLAIVQRMVGVVRIRTGEQGPDALLP